MQVSVNEQQETLWKIDGPLPSHTGSDVTGRRCAHQNLLQHLHDETLQIPRLRHAGQNRMVGALASLLDKPDVSFGVSGCKPDAVPEISFGHRMRTTTSNQKPVRLQQLQTQQIDVLVTS